MKKKNHKISWCCFLPFLISTDFFFYKTQFGADNWTVVKCHFSSVESEYIHTSACVSFYSWRIAYKILYLSQPYIWSGLKFAILLLRVHKNISVPSFFENMIVLSVSPWVAGEGLSWRRHATSVGWWRWYI